MAPYEKFIIYTCRIKFTPPPCHNVMTVNSTRFGTGEISFSNVTLRYSDDESTPAALKSLSLKIEGGQKVGICGRTGAGKSSVLSVLFRLQEICAGNVFIDGVDIAHVPVRILRARLSIIPQDPFLFTGTVRENLDQSLDEGAKRQDDELWQALERLDALLSSFK